MYFFGNQLKWNEKSLQLDLEERLERNLLLSALDMTIKSKYKGRFSKNSI